MQGYRNIIIKLISFLLLLIVAGLPINEIYSFSLILLFLPIIIFSTSLINARFFYFCIGLFFLIGIKFLIPQIKIYEDHNLIILNKYSKNFYKINFPNEVYEFIDQKFKFYEKNSNCDLNLERCWKNFDPERFSNKYNRTNKINSISSDWSLDKTIFSRIVNNINFSNIQSARIGEINNLSTNYFWPKKNDITRETIPYFVKYQIPEILIGSSLCWRGNVFWQYKDKSYLHLYNDIYKCKKFSHEDTNKVIYAISLGSHVTFEKLNYLHGNEFINDDDYEFKNFLKKNNLILKLEKSFQLKIYSLINFILKILIILFICFLFFKSNLKIYFFSFLYLLSFLFLLKYVDTNLFFGFDIFTGGNDGLVYMSYGNTLFNYLINFNFYEFFRGVENVFYFPSSLRFFWPINKIFFGDSFYGYILIGYLTIIILYYIFLNLFGFKLAIFISLLIFFTRIFEGYALSIYKFLQHIQAGDAEPLAIFSFLMSILLFLIIIKSEKINTKNLSLYSFGFGFFLFISISLRPNFSPTALLFLLLYLSYNFIYFQNIKHSFYSILGFSFYFLIPFHNYFYGDSFILFSSGSQYNTQVPIIIYKQAFIDILNFKLNTSESIYQINSQIIKWIKPDHFHYIISFLILFYSLFSNNNFNIKTICLLAISQHIVLLIFEPSGRYSYLAWILTFIVCINFFMKIYNNLNKSYYKN